MDSILEGMGIDTGMDMDMEGGRSLGTLEGVVRMLDYRCLRRRWKKEWCYRRIRMQRM